MKTNKLSPLRPKLKYRDIDYQIDNFFLGLKMFSGNDPDGLSYMLEALYELASCEGKFDDFFIKTIKKYSDDLDPKIVEKICNKKK